MTLAEIVVVVALGGIATMLAVPQLAKIEARARAAAGARSFAMTLYALRWKSVSRGVGHGMLFGRDAGGWYWWEVRDGNGNGLLAREVRVGVDVTVSGPHRLQEQS